MKNLRKMSLGLSGLSLILLIAGLYSGQAAVWQPAALCLSIFFSFGIGALPSLKSYQYTAWIITAVVAGMVYPNAFRSWGGFDLRNKWLILVVVQTVMFGMGIHMS